MNHSVASVFFFLVEDAVIIADRYLLPDPGENAFQKVKGNIRFYHDLAQSSTVVLSHSDPEPGAGLFISKH